MVQTLHFSRLHFLNWIKWSPTICCQLHINDTGIETLSSCGYRGSWFHQKSVLKWSVPPKCFQVSKFCFLDALASVGSTLPGILACWAIVSDQRIFKTCKLFFSLSPTPTGQLAQPKLNATSQLTQLYTTYATCRSSRHPLFGATYPSEPCMCQGRLLSPVWSGGRAVKSSSQPVTTIRQSSTYTLRPAPPPSNISENSFSRSVT